MFTANVTPDYSDNVDDITLSFVLVCVSCVFYFLDSVCRSPVVNAKCVTYDSHLFIRTRTSRVNLAGGGPRGICVLWRCCGVLEMYGLLITCPVCGGVKKHRFVTFRRLNEKLKFAHL